MTTTNRGGGSADQKELAGVWRQLSRGLASVIETLIDEGQLDPLSIELLQTESDGSMPCAQFAGFAGDNGVAIVHAEVSGNSYLSSTCQLGTPACTAMVSRGWEGNLEGADEDESYKLNWYVELPLTSADRLAKQVVKVIRDHFSIAHPQMLVVKSRGPVAGAHDHAGMLGFTAADDVPSDGRQSGPGADLVFPQTQDELRQMSREILGDRFGDIDSDDDGDLMLRHMGQQVCVDVTPEQPVLVIAARVARSVHSHRAAAVEPSILNRDHPWTKWALRDRDVRQTSALHAHPLMPSQLIEGVGFLGAMSATRDDLAFRSGAQVA